MFDVDLSVELTCGVFAASCRGLHGAVWHQLLLPVVWNQRVDDDFHALSLQRPQYLCLELSGCGHHRAVPHRQEVSAAFSHFPPWIKRLWFVNGSVFFSLRLSFPGARALASATPCASWQPCWATWSLARWLASPKPFPSCWRRPCWSVAAWWDSDCQTRGPTSSCKPLRENRFFTRCLKKKKPRRPIICQIFEIFIVGKFCPSRQTRQSNTW